MGNSVSNCLDSNYCLTAETAIAHPDHRAWLRARSACIITHHGYQEQRNTVRGQDIQPAKVWTDNPHGQSAAERTSGTIAMENMCKNLNLTPWYLSKSNSQISKQAAGSRTFAPGWKDAGYTAHGTTRLQSWHAICIVDTDHWLTEVQWEAIYESGKIVLIYGQDMRDVAGVVPGATFNYDPKAQEWVFTHPDITYQHPLYDHPSDTVGLYHRSMRIGAAGGLAGGSVGFLAMYEAIKHAPKKTAIAVAHSLHGHTVLAAVVATVPHVCAFAFVFGAVYAGFHLAYNKLPSTRVYHVTRCADPYIGSQKSITVYIPVSDYPAPLSFLSDDDSLTKFEPKVGKTVVSVSYCSGVEDPYVSMALIGSHLSVRIPIRIVAAVRARAERQSRAVTHGNAVEIAKKMDFTLSVEAADLMLLYIRDETPETPTRHAGRRPRQMGFRINPDYSNEENLFEGPNHFMAPFFDAAYMHTMDKRNEEYCIEKRVVEVLSDPPPLAAFECKILESFVDLLGIDGWEPFTADEVWEKQDTPKKRQIITDALESIAPDGENAPMLEDILCFMKQEVGSINAPRNISPVDCETKLQWSAYMLGLAKCLKKHKWYSPGNSPMDIAEGVRVRALLGKRTCAETDFSKMDGTVSKTARTVEDRVLLRVKTTFHDHVKRVYSATMNRKCRGRFGTKFNSEMSRLSGEPGTSILNTIIAVFMHFLGLVYQFMSLGASYDEAIRSAWEGLGVYNGDDGLTGDLEAEFIVQASKKLGFTTKVANFQRGAVVGYLSRKFMFCDHPTANSTTDIIRSMSKIHASTDSQTPDCVLMYRRSRDIAQNDANTPILNRIIAKMSAISKEGHNAEMRLHPNRDINDFNYWATRAELEGGGFPNELEGWMDDYADDCLGDLDTHALGHWLHDPMSTGDTIPLLWQPEHVLKPGMTVEIGVAEDAVMHTAPEETPPQTTAPVSEPPSSPRPEADSGAGVGSPPPDFFWPAVAQHGPLGTPIAPLSVDMLALDLDPIPTTDEVPGAHTPPGSPRSPMRTVGFSVGPARPRRAVVRHPVRVPRHAATRDSVRAPYVEARPEPDWAAKKAASKITAPRPTAAGDKPVTRSQTGKTACCKHFLRGKCTYGAKCKHPHVKSSIKCGDNTRGKCPRGEACPYTH